MSFDIKEIEASFQFDADEVHEIKSEWMTLIEILMWDDVSSKKIGALPRSRKRVLEVGESFRSFISSKAWIDQPRQQLKSALGSSVKLRDSLSALTLVNKHITEGSDANKYQQCADNLQTILMKIILKYENLWANILENQQDDEEE